MQRLSVLALGLACAIFWGFAMLFLGLAAKFGGYGTEVVTLIGKLYIGFAPTVFGSFLGFIWGTIDGFICGVVLAWLYNFINSKLEPSE